MNQGLLLPALYLTAGNRILREHAPALFVIDLEMRRVTLAGATGTRQRIGFNRSP